MVWSGLSFRPPHFEQLLKYDGPPIWLQILYDNFPHCPGNLALLEQLAPTYELSFHCVGMNLASSEPLDKNYFTSLRSLLDRYNVGRVSDHLCWTKYKNHFFHDLLPFPRNEKTLKHITERVHQIQEWLARPLIVENVSGYLTPTGTSLSEQEFLNSLCQRTECQILLDINNVYVNGHNFNFCPKNYIDQLCLEYVSEIHLAGHQAYEDLLIDTHSAVVAEPVWELLKYTAKKLGPTPLCIEWDNDLPGFDILLEQSNRAREEVPWS